MKITDRNPEKETMGQKREKDGPGGIKCSLVKVASAAVADWWGAVTVFKWGNCCINKDNSVEDYSSLRVGVVCWMLVVVSETSTWDYFQTLWVRGLKLLMVLSLDLTRKILPKNTNRTAPTTLPPPKQMRKAHFYIFCPMLMKFCMEVTFGGIQLKRNTSVRPMFNPLQLPSLPPPKPP